MPARRAFESLDTLLAFEQRVAFAYRIAVANIAEEVLNVAIRHGVDPRDFSIVAYGAAGPMLLPAALELLHARRVVVPPHPGLFSAIGLLSTDLVYYESRSAYVVLAPEAASQLDSVFTEMEERLRAKVGDGADGMTVRRTIDGRLLGQSWETPFVELPGGPITEATIPELVERFHAEYERRYGNRFPYMPVQGVTLPRAGRRARPRRSTTSPATGRQARPSRAARSRCATWAPRSCRQGSTTARRSLRERVSPALR